MIKEKLKFLKKNKLTYSSIVYTFSTFCNSAIPFLLLPMLTAYLTTEEYGIVSMFNATASALLPFVSMSVSTAVVRKMVDANKDEIRAYVFNCVIIVLFSASLFSFIIYLFKESISEITGIPIDYLTYMVMYLASCAFCEMSLAILQMQERVKEYAIFQNMCTLLNALTSIILVVVFGLSLEGRLFGIIFPKLIFSIVGLFIVHKRLGYVCKFKIEYIKEELLEYGIPMIPTQIKSTILTYTDRLFITIFLSVSVTGVYSVGNQFSMPILLIAQAFNLAYIPWLFKNLKEDKLESKIKIVKFTYLYFIVIIVAALLWASFAKLLIPLVVAEEYYGATDYVFWLSLGYAFTGMHMMVVNYIYYAKKVKAYAVVTILVILSNVFLNYIFIRINGAIGTAQATLCANAVSFILTWILAAKVYKMPWFNMFKKNYK